MEEPTRHPIPWPISPIHHSNLKLSPAQNELLQWHHRSGHMGFKKIQLLMKTEVLANVEVTKSLHTSTCMHTTYPFAQHLSLENRDKGHLQAKEAQWSRMSKAT